METFLPEDTNLHGFINEPRASLGRTTILLNEASRLFEVTTPDTPYVELQRLVVEENILLKQTESNRKLVFRGLREMYGLRQAMPVYKVFRALWDTSPIERRLLAMLLCAAREPVLRATASMILGKMPEAPVTAHEFESAIEAHFPGRYSQEVRGGMSRRTASSWQQSGHLTGKVKKVRGKAKAGPATTTYALFLGYLCGLRGQRLFDTLWVRLLDSTRAEVHEFAFEASRHAWLEYRHVADVIDITFSQYQPLIQECDHGKH